MRCTSQRGQELRGFASLACGCQIIMNTGECPDCIDKFIPDVVTETYEEAKVEKKKEEKKVITKPVQTKRNGNVSFPLVMIGLIVMEILL